MLAHLQAIVVAWALALARGRALPRLRVRLPTGYAALGKGAAIATQTLLLLRMLRLWWRPFRNPLLWRYPLFTMGLTTLFGALLKASGDQLWHLVIGPGGSLSLLVLWRLQLRAERAPTAPPPP